MFAEIESLGSESRASPGCCFAMNPRPGRAAGASQRLTRPSAGSVSSALAPPHCRGPTRERTSPRRARPGSLASTSCSSREGRLPRGLCCRGDRALVAGRKCPRAAGAGSLSGTLLRAGRNTKHFPSFRKDKYGSHQKGKGVTMEPSLEARQLSADTGEGTGGQREKQRKIT